MASSRWRRFADRHPRAAERLVGLRPFLPPLNFITIHYAYFIGVCLVFSLVFWGSSSPAMSISYTDSLFLVVSGMSEAGLNTVNLSQITTWQQFILFLLIIVGSSIWVSIWTVLFRKHVFEQRCDAIVRAHRMRRLSRGSLTFSRTFSFGRRPADRSTSSDSTAVATLASEATATAAAPAYAPPAARAVMAEDASAPGETEPARRQDDDADGDGADDEDAIRPAAAAAPAAATGRVAFAADLDSAGGRSTAAAVSPDYADGRPTRRFNRNGGPGQTAGDDEKPGLFSSRTIGRNAQFHNLSTKEREQLGGCEYRALMMLAVVVPAYFFLWQFLGCVALGAWIKAYMPDAARANALNPWWVGIFNGASAFNNSGMSLLDLNVIPFESSYFVLIVMGLMILAGNTAYPIFLRLTFWAGLRLLRLATADNQFADEKATIEFILRYPRRVYTNLFPARPTWWLLFMLVLLNSIDWAAFELLNLGNPVIESIPPGSRALDGLFQALAVRSGGFYVVPISSVYIGLQILYVIMMYISVYPVVITMRHSNVYEERSLGIYDDDGDPEHQQELQQLRWQPTDEEGGHASDRRRASGTFIAGLGANIGERLRRSMTAWNGVGVRGPAAPPASASPSSPSSPSPAESRINFITQQIQGQLAHDLWMLVLAVLIISTIETSHFLADPATYSVFNVIFEVVSAYGCVGISIGLPNAAYSFSGGWHSASKLVLCLVMVRGRHRGLPVAIDRAVRLPGEQLHRDEEEDFRIRQSRTIRRDQ